MNQRFVKVAVALLCGGLIALSCASFDIWPLAWIAWAPVLWAVLDKRTDRPWAYGFLCGFAGNAIAFYWFIPYLQRFGHLPLVASLPIFLLFVSYQAAIWALFSHVLRRLRSSGLPVIFLAPIVFVAIEAAVPNIFPWYFAITQAWVVPVIQISELTGPLGVSFLLMLSNATLYESVHAWYAGAMFPRRRVLAAIGVLAASLVFGFGRMHQVRATRDAAPKVKVGVVQANIGINEKGFLAYAQKQLAAHQSASAELEQSGAELIIWPESSYPYVFRRDRFGDSPRGDLRRLRVGFQTPVLFGALTIGGGSRFQHNSALMLDRDDRIRGRFDKNILIVFGEYIPYFDQLGFIQRWIPATNNLARGSDVAVLPFESKSGTVQIGPMICYEDTFASFGRRLAPRGPNVLVNLTNDAWFGNTSEPWQHLALSVYRAVELRLDFVRAVNTGVSAFIDSTGRVYARTRSVDPDQTPNVQPETLLQEVAIQQAQTLYATLGEWFAGVCIVVAFVLFLRVRRIESSPVRWDLVAIGAAALLGAIVLVAAVTGPGHLPLVLKLLVNRGGASSVAADQFAATWRLFLGTLAGSLVLGFLIARRAKTSSRSLENALAVIAIWIAPALAFGRLEGQQAGLVIVAILGVALARFGARLAGRA